MVDSGHGFPPDPLFFIGRNFFDMTFREILSLKMFMLVLKSRIFTFLQAGVLLEIGKISCLVVRSKGWAWHDYSIKGMLKKRDIKVFSYTLTCHW